MTDGRTDRRPAKIEDVAREAGVSIMSVSRVMRGVEGVSAKRRTEILAIAKRLGYAPNRVAGSLAAANSTLIGVSVPTLFEAVFAEIFAGMRDIFSKAGFQTVMDTTEYQPDRERRWVSRMVSWHPAGIILSGIDHTNRARRQLVDAGIPTLEIWDHTDDPIDLCVGVDHFAAGRAVGRHLVALGYRRPAYVGIECGWDRRAEARFHGFCEAFSEKGVTRVPDFRADRRASFESGRCAAERALGELADNPDVLYFLNDHMAFGGLMACEAHGLDVPRDIGIAGFNGLNINAVLKKPLTTSITPRTLMGATGARMLVAKILGAKTERSICMPVELFAGETTRPLRASSGFRPVLDAGANKRG
ncbi:LacI family DNA-binding transcriptional regulator [Nitratireductor sp. XY-223]|uniref:LacI family DNA-binding transcriptional regulator n=1 Tax=Nitratireductor sp. XY-223 TaxID=2561926 RepID=UPI0010AA0DD6|nr:LacI family DNA-binding transcriptional regulator [Nitratireductor sp. XY-223]